MIRHLFFCLLFLTSCQMHRQESYITGQTEGPVFALEANDRAFASLSDDDYFVLESILKNGQFDPNHPNASGQILLVEAVRLKKVLFAQLILEEGGDPHLLDSNGDSAYQLVEEFSEDKVREVWLAILQGEELAGEFLDQQAIKLVQEGAQDKQEAIIKNLTILFAKGADVNAKNDSDYTLLMLAALKNLVDLVHFLCNMEEISINMPGIRGHTVLSLLKINVRRRPELVEVMEILRSYGAVEKLD